MSASQLIIFVLIVAAFALGWWGRGRRTPPPANADGDSLDKTVGLTLTAFQAALSLWQAQGTGHPSSDALASQSVAVFTRRRGALAATALRADAAPQTRTAYERAQRAADRLADGLSAFANGSALDLERERALISAERALSTARLELRAAAVETGSYSAASAPGSTGV